MLTGWPPNLEGGESQGGQYIRKSEDGGEKSGRSYGTENRSCAPGEVVRFQYLELSMAGRLWSLQILFFSFLSEEHD